MLLQNIKFMAIILYRKLSLCIIFITFAKRCITWISMAYIKRILKDVTPIPTSHGIGVKQVLLANGETSSAVTQIAKSSLEEGEKVEEHIHPTMDEHYLCLSGEGILFVDHQKITFIQDTYVLVKAGSSHYLEATSDVTFLTIGVATECRQSRWAEPLQ